MVAIPVERLSEDQVFDVVAPVPEHDDLDVFVAAHYPPGVRPWDSGPVGAHS